MFLDLKTIFLFCKKSLEKGLSGFEMPIQLVLVVVLLQISFCAFPQINAPKFIQISTTNGLSQGHVNAILKDKKGFMWFATDGGLNKYDGYKFTTYKQSVGAAILCLQLYFL